MTRLDDDTTEPAPEERESTPNSAGPHTAAGGMGSSSERVGHVGPGQTGTDGLRDNSQVDSPADAPPEQSSGGEEPKPDPVEPKAGHPKLDPQHEEKPYHG